MYGAVRGGSRLRQAGIGQERLCRLRCGKACLLVRQPSLLSCGYAADVALTAVNPAHE